MKENAIRFLYAIDCYLLYLLSGVAASVGVVAYYSIVSAQDYSVFDSAVFVDYVAEFVSGKSSLVLLVSYCIIFVVLMIVFAIRRRSLGSYTGMSYARFFSVVGAAVLGVVINLITFSITPVKASGGDDISIILLLCVVLAPFVEELVFRGILLKMFGSACGVIAASVITSVLFAISHTDPIQMLYAFVLGVLLSVVRVKSTSLWSAVAMHLAFNITGAVMAMYNVKFSRYNLVVFAVVAIISLVAACSGGRRLFQEGE